MLVKFKKWEKREAKMKFHKIPKHDEFDEKNKKLVIVII